MKTYKAIYKLKSDNLIRYVNHIYSINIKGDSVRLHTLNDGYDYEFNLEDVIYLNIEEEK